MKTKERKKIQFEMTLTSTIPKVQLKQTHKTMETGGGLVIPFIFINV